MIRPLCQSSETEAKHMQHLSSFKGYKIYKTSFKGPLIAWVNNITICADTWCFNTILRPTRTTWRMDAARHTVPKENEQQEAGTTDHLWTWQTHSQHNTRVASGQVSVAQPEPEQSRFNTHITPMQRTDDTSHPSKVMKVCTFVLYRCRFSIFNDLKKNTFPITKMWKLKCNARKICLCKRWNIFLKWHVIDVFINRIIPSKTWGGKKPVCRKKC